MIFPVSKIFSEPKCPTTQLFSDFYFTSIFLGARSELNNSSEEETDLDKIFKQQLSPVQIQGILSLGKILRITGSLNQSEQLLEKTLKVVKKTLPQEESKALIYLGNTKVLIAKRLLESNPDLQQKEDAKKYQKQALENYRQAAINSNPTISIQAQLNQLNLLLELKSWSDANKILPSITSSIENLPLTQTKIYSEIKLARKKVCLKQQNPQCIQQVVPNLTNVKNNSQYSYQEATKLLENAVKEARQIDNKRTLSDALGNLGWVYTYAQQSNLAKENTQEALFIAHSIGAKDLEYEWDWQLAILLKNENKEIAINYYNKAFEIVNTLRGDLVALNPEIQFTFRENVEPIYREYVDLLLPINPSQANLKRALEVMESLKIAELNNFFRDNCVENQLTEEESLEKINSIDFNATILYTIILENRLEVIASIPGQLLQNYKTELPRKLIEKDLENIQNQIINLIDYPKDQILKNHLHIWYDHLISPIENQLDGNSKTTLVFILDGWLRNIPMSALYDGKQYLIEKYKIATVSSINLLDTQPFSRKQIEVFAAGLSEDNDLNDNFGPLPNVQTELENIQQSIPVETILLNQEFQKSNFDQKVQQSKAKIIHLATHGKFSSTAEDTFVLAWDGRINLYELDRILRSQQNQNRTVDLLVFSACETGLGDDRTTLGLAGVAVRAGVRTTIGSLWEVYDRGTQLLMNKFYEELAASTTNPEITKAEALRRAQIQILHTLDDDGAVSDLSHPYFWSAFILVGNWL